MAQAMFTLTAMTGREASAHRTVVIGTVEMNWRVWMILLGAFPLAIISTLILMPFVGISSLLMIPLIEGGAVFAIHRRSRSGLKLRTYQSFYDKRRAVLNQYMLGQQPIDLDLSRFETLYSASAPNPEMLAALEGDERDRVLASMPSVAVRPAPRAVREDEPMYDMSLIHDSVDDILTDLTERTGDTIAPAREREVAVTGESPHDRGMPSFAPTSEGR